jgi:hypothetical protein
MSDNLQKAIASIKAGNKAAGKQLLAQILKADPQNEQAWLWLTKVVDTNQERIQCLQKVMAINPHNETAKYVLASLQQQPGTGTPISAPAESPSKIKAIKKISPDSAAKKPTTRKPLKRLSSQKYRTANSAPPATTPAAPEQPLMSSAAALHKLAMDRQRGITPSLSGNNLQGVDLAGADISEASLYNVNLSQGNLQHTNLRHTILNGANLSDANIKNANLSDARLEKVNLSGADLSEANCNGAQFDEADLSKANLTRTNLSWANLNGSNLQGANFDQTNLREAKLYGADLRNADLSRAKLHEALFNETTLWPQGFDPERHGAIQVWI